MSNRHAVIAPLSLGLWKDGLGAALQEAGRPPAVGSLDKAALHEAQVAFKGLLRRESARESKPDASKSDFNDEAQFVQQERDLGNQLLHLLTREGMQAIGARLNHLSGRAEAEGLPFRLLIDARDPHLEQLPWELLEVATLPGTGHTGLQILRLWQRPGSSPPPEGPDVHLALMGPHLSEAVSVAASSAGAEPSLPTRKTAPPLPSTSQELPSVPASGLARRWQSLSRLAQSLPHVHHGHASVLDAANTLPASCRLIRHSLMKASAKSHSHWSTAEGMEDGIEARQEAANPASAALSLDTLYPLDTLSPQDPLSPQDTQYPRDNLPTQESERTLTPVDPVVSAQAQVSSSSRESSPRESSDGASTGAQEQLSAPGIRLEVVELLSADSKATNHVPLPVSPALTRYCDAEALLISALPWQEEGAERFFTTFYGALHRGEALVEALQEARRRLTVASLLTPGGRWWQPRLFLCSPELASPPPGLALRQIPGLGVQGQVEAEAVLEQALHLARPQGFLGIEHLALGLAATPHPPPLLAVLQPRLASLARDLMAFGIQPNTPSGEILQHRASGPPPPLTPRLQRLLAQLPQGFDLESLTERLLDAPQASELLLLRAGQNRPSPLREGLSADAEGVRSVVAEGLFFSHKQSAEPHQGPMILEVVGGPEDGRLLKLEREGQQVGRWDPALDHPDALWLFEEGLPIDRTVSRRHFRYGGQWNVEVLAPLRWEHAPMMARSPGAPVPRSAQAPSTLAGPDVRRQDLVTQGWIVLEPGDVLRLGAATRLRVLISPEGIP